MAAQPGRTTTAGSGARKGPKGRAGPSPAQQGFSFSAGQQRAAPSPPRAASPRPAPPPRPPSPPPASPPFRATMPEPQVIVRTRVRQVPIPVPFPVPFEQAGQFVALQRKTINRLTQDEPRNAQGMMHMRNAPGFETVEGGAEQKDDSMSKLKLTGIGVGVASAAAIVGSVLVRAGMDPKTVAGALIVGGGAMAALSETDNTLAIGMCVASAGVAQVALDWIGKKHEQQKLVQQAAIAASLARTQLPASPAVQVLPPGAGPPAGAIPVAQTTPAGPPRQGLSAEMARAFDNVGRRIARAS